LEYYDELILIYQLVNDKLGTLSILTMYGMIEHRCGKKNMIFAFHPNPLISLEKGFVMDIFRPTQIAKRFNSGTITHFP